MDERNVQSLLSVRAWGLAVAATLRRVGIEVAIYEQAQRFRIGAGIQMMPNSMKVMRGIGIEEPTQDVVFALLASTTIRPITRKLPMPESLYWALYLACTVPICTTRSHPRCQPRSCMLAGSS